MRILRGPDWLLIDTEPHALPALARNVEMYSIGRDVQLRDETAERAILSLVGPAAREALDAEPPADRARLGRGRARPLRDDRPGRRRDLRARTTPKRSRAALGVEPVAPEAAECVRIESGRPRHGLDFDAETIPQEAGLNERAVSFTKGCYVGQETVARLHYKGKPNRHLRGLKLSEPGQHGRRRSCSATARSAGSDRPPYPRSTDRSRSRWSAARPLRERKSRSAKTARTPWSSSFRSTSLAAAQGWRRVGRACTKDSRRWPAASPPL